MSSLKEQREQLLQEKMKEMADIGVKKRTAENTPDFDEP
ncbi:conjugal transfer protein TraC, partial [Prevotella bivia DNF00320]